MMRNALIDLYFPAHTAPPAQVHARAKERGLDAVVLVAETDDDLPDPETINALNAEDGPTLHVARRLSGVGYRVLVLVTGEVAEGQFDAIEAAGDMSLIAAAVQELSGCGVSICPRQGAEGQVNRETAPLGSEPPVGVVAVVAKGSRLGRDLDIEDAALGGRRVLAGTGPFGDLEDSGRYATLVPADPADMSAIIACLNAGRGVGVELLARGADLFTGEVPGPDKRAGDGKKPRRKRRRGRKKGGGGGGGEAKPA